MNRAERRRRTRAVANRYHQPWRKLRWPWASRGAREGVKENAKLWHAAERTRVRDELKTFDVADPDADSPRASRGRRSAVWELF